MSWAKQSAAILRTIGYLREMRAEAEMVTGESVGGESVSSGESIADPSTPAYLRMGAGFARGSAVGTAQKIIKEAVDTRKAADKTIVELEKMFGELSTFQEKAFKRMYEVSNKQYNGATLMHAIANILESLQKVGNSRTPATGTYQLLQRLDGILKAFELNFLGGMSGVNVQTFLSLLNNKKKPGGGTSGGTSTGALP